MDNYKELAQFIVLHIGGKDNVKRLTHCMTRLRFVLKDETLANTTAIKNRDGIATVIMGGGEYQVVIGNKVIDVFEQLDPLLNIEEDNDPKEKQSMLDYFMDTISQIFNPVLGLLCGTGIIAGLNMVLVALKLITKDSGTYQILNVIGNSFLYYSPILLGFTAAKRFKMNPFTGATIGACLIHPVMLGILNQEPIYTAFQGTMIESSVFTTFLNIPVLMMSYTSSVIPIIIACYVAAKVERILKKKIPAVLKLFMVPAITLSTVVPFTILLIGPISIWLSQIISVSLSQLHGIMPVLSGALIAGFWQILIVFGLHRGFTPITLSNLQLFGYDSVFAVRLVITFAVFGTVIAVFLKTRNKKIKEIALPAAISSFFGISEPAIYGISMPYRKLFVTSCIAAAIGGAVLSFFHTKIYSVAGLGILALPGYIGPNGIDLEFVGAVLGILSATISAFVLAQIFWKDEVIKIETDKVETRKSIIEITSPLDGEIVALADVKDELFSSCALGAGIAIEPINNVVVAPVDAYVSALFPSGHAIGITTYEGVEILIHIGMDTVNLQGSYFDVKVSKGDCIKKGQELIVFDAESIKAKGYVITTPIVITNSIDFPNIELTKGSKVHQGDKLISITSTKEV